MGGKIIEYEARTYYLQGRQDALAEAEEKHLKEIEDIRKTDKEKWMNKCINNLLKAHPDWTFEQAEAEVKTMFS